MNAFVVLKQPDDPKAPTVLEGDLVRINYEAILTASKKVIESTSTRGESRAIVVGRDKVAKGLIKGVLSMKQGMKIKLTVSPQYAYGANGIPGVVPPNSEIDYIIELVEHHVAEENKKKIEPEFSESDLSTAPKPIDKRRI